MTAGSSFQLPPWMASSFLPSNCLPPWPRSSMETTPRPLDATDQRATVCRSIPAGSGRTPAGSTVPDWATPVRCPDGKQQRDGGDRAGPGDSHGGRRANVCRGPALVRLVGMSTTHHSGEMDLLVTGRMLHLMSCEGVQVTGNLIMTHELLAKQAAMLYAGWYWYAASDVLRRCQILIRRLINGLARATLYDAFDMSVKNQDAQV